jgi:hypothetical protein
MFTTTQTEDTKTASTTGWNDDTDGRFFTITASLFNARFTEGATALLQSYDA